MRKLKLKLRYERVLQLAEQMVPIWSEPFARKTTGNSVEQRAQHVERD